MDSCPVCGSEDIEDTPQGPACIECGCILSEYDDDDEDEAR